MSVEESEPVVPSVVIDPVKDSPAKDTGVIVYVMGWAKAAKGRTARVAQKRISEMIKRVEQFDRMWLLLLSCSGEV
jgi:hypothetical protein